MYLSVQWVDKLIEYKTYFNTYTSSQDAFIHTVIYLSHINLYWKHVWITYVIEHKASGISLATTSKI